MKSLMKMAVLLAAVAVLFCASSCSAQNGAAAPSSASPPTPSVATPSEAPPSEANSPSNEVPSPTTKNNAAPAAGITWTAMIWWPTLLLCLWLPLLLA